MKIGRLTMETPSTIYSEDSAVVSSLQRCNLATSAWRKWPRFAECPDGGRNARFVGTAESHPRKVRRWVSGYQLNLPFPVSHPIDPRSNVSGNTPFAPAEDSSAGTQPERRLEPAYNRRAGRSSPKAVPAHPFCWSSKKAKNPSPENQSFLLLPGVWADLGG